ncbi:Origin recognition complex subunit 2 [Aphelenchoides fujianensis]|nr:Origin recognition complex subunit 2 [Aphelenchoides fujianensis]
MSNNLDISSLYSVKGIAVVDQDGNRILAKYYDKTTFPTEKDEVKFEKNLFQKTYKANSEIILLDGLICVYRSNVDLFFYVIGTHQENELILVSVLNALYESFSTVLRRNVEKKALLDNMDVAMLIVDEICDDGVILETEPTAIVGRCALKADEIAFGDQSISQVGMSLLGSAKDQLKWSLLKMTEQMKPEEVATEIFDQIRAGFNVLIRGRGSKIQLLKKLKPLARADGFTFVRLLGHQEDVRPVSILKEVSGELHKECTFQKATLVEDAKHLASSITKDVCLVINNLNGENLRDPLTLEMLAALTRPNKRKHRVALVATLYGENGDLYWDSELRRQLNFVEFTINIEAFDAEEIAHFNKKLLGGKGRKFQNLHSEESLGQIWDSLPEAARKIFKQMYALIQESENQAIAFNELYQELRNKLLVNSEMVLEGHMKELCSHCLVSMSDDRMVKFEVEPSVLGVFMDQKLVE